MGRAPPLRLNAQRSTLNAQRSTLNAQRSTLNALHGTRMTTKAGAKDTNRETPMLAQYRGIKARYPDVILMFRLGDFYEMFWDDARVASEALEITLTARPDPGRSDKIPMCGVP